MTLHLLFRDTLLLNIHMGRCILNVQISRNNHGVSYFIGMNLSHCLYTATSGSSGAPLCLHNLFRWYSNICPVIRMNMHRSGERLVCRKQNIRRVSNILPKCVDNRRRRRERRTTIRYISRRSHDFRPYLIRIRTLAYLKLLNKLEKHATATLQISNEVVDTTGRAGSNKVIFATKLPNLLPPKWSNHVRPYRNPIPTNLGNFRKTALILIID